MVIKASAPVKKKQGESVLPKQRAMKLARDKFTKKIRDSAQPNDREQQDRPAGNFAVDSTQQAAQFVSDKAVNGSMQKAKIAIQQRQNFIKERKAQAAEKKAQVVEAVHKGQDISRAELSRGIQPSPTENRAGIYRSESSVHIGIDYAPFTPQPKYAAHDPVQRPAAESGFSQAAYRETPVQKSEPFTHRPIATNSNLHKNQSIHRSVQPPAGEAGRSSIKEHNSDAFAPKEKPVRGPSAIKSRRAEETVKNLTDPIKTDMINTNRAATFPKLNNSVKPVKSAVPRRSAGKALMERAARKMKLHSQKQLAQKAGKTAKATGAATKKAAVVTVRAARALISALAGLVGGTGVFILLAVVLLGGALSAFGASPGTGIYTPVSAEVEAFEPTIRIYATQHGIPEYVDLIKAVMMQESGGNVELVGGDVMQCAEGMGLPVGTPVDPERSIDFGTSIIANNLQLAGATGPGDIPHISLALQGYNFGNGYISWALARGGYSKENAREFSVWQAGIHGWSGYGDIDYVDHVLRYYPLAANPLGGASAIAEGRFAFPFPGHTWDTYSGHNGIDISFANCYGEPVYACAPGTVRYIQDGWTPAHGVNNMWSFGNCVVVDHVDGWQSVYAHLSRLAVVPGTPIRQGQLVGNIGSTGNSTGPHLHLALYYHGSPGENGMNYAEMAWPQYRG
ncbi:hypothetical protein D7X94_10350 [Acutalibacter sp. 1XD8-33]|uniref:lysozyme family protein n=1 Tax=Acutalibacter sp. 1XD8-33 TaxID=2320081 RepID=UPI000EA0118A|nr:lysozyme family protein [Acutalibacter sp. 1XD8-33]RKJ39817.1 hypothetical protein D7X94_10350 [Acutalibacter sp. 1XD8-33]